MSKKLDKLAELEKKEKSIKDNIRRLRADIAKKVRKEDERLKYLLGELMLSQLSLKTKPQIQELVEQSKAYFKREKDNAFVLNKLQVFLDKCSDEIVEDTIDKEAIAVSHGEPKARANSPQAARARQQNLYGGVESLESSSVMRAVHEGCVTGMVTI